MSEVKICSKCGVEKPLEEFFRSKKRRLGRGSLCKLCARKYQQVWYKEHFTNVKTANHNWRMQHLARVRENSCRWQREHPEEARANKRRSYLKLHEAIKVSRRRWRLGHKDKIREYARRYYEKSIEKKRELTRRYRAQKRQAEGNFSEVEWKILCDRFGNKCLACHRVDVPLTRDHVIPMGPPFYGTNFIWNIQPLCRSCNTKKRRGIDDYRFSHRFEKAV